MDDVVLAQTLRAGGTTALANVLDRYESELYDYAVTLLGDPALAAAAVHDALLAATALAARLVDPRQFRPWLYALVRAEAVRRRDSAAAEVGDPGGDDATTGQDSDGGGTHGSGAHEAAAGILVSRGGPRKVQSREVTDLVHRQLMNDSEVAHVLGIGEYRARRLRVASDKALAEDSGEFVPFRASQRSPAPAGLGEDILAAAADPGRLLSAAEAVGPLRRSGFPAAAVAARSGRSRPSALLHEHAGRSAAVIAASLGILVIVLLATVSSSPISVIQLSGGRGASPSPSPAGRPGNGARPSATPSPPASGRPSGPASPTASASPVPSGPASAVPEPSTVPPGQPVQGGPITGPGGKCLDVPFKRTADGTPIGVFTCNSSISQRWSGGAAESLRAMGKCLDFEVPQPNTTVQRAVLWPCDGTASQHWSALRGLLVNRANGRCLELPPGQTANLTTTRIAECTGAANQVWRLDP